MVNIVQEAMELITTILEGYWIAYEVNYFVNKKNIDKKVLLISTILLSVMETNMFLSIFTPLWRKITISALLAFVIIGIIYRRNCLRALIPCSIAILSLFSITILIEDNICSIIIHTYRMNNNFMRLFFPITIVRCINAIFQLKYKDYMYDFYERIMNEGKYLIIFLFFLDIMAVFTQCSFVPAYELNNEALKSVILIIFYIFLILIFFNIIKIAAKSREIYKLNLELELNNKSLRKIKHDYGAQISYLYGLCLMERFDDLKKSIKDIIEKSNYSSGIVEEKTNSILFLSINQAVDRADIEIEIKESAKLYEVNMHEMDLFRVFYNISRNAVEAMGGKGKIEAESYKKDNEIIISIKNNGPEISKKTIDKIFNTGFTTKDNTEKGHGYGLSIVKELVENGDGKIAVNSSPELTEFKLTFRTNY
ncbi:Histidine kinase-, DNA gyrase B-, and HSP90-like ATPase [Clostridium sp. DSM 8431]|uniref:sensor histidine kinase n=1 Tax=Clostridium sp. DSM 8431 TaxID=1761781 RepID=UPI0008EDBAB7|nr:ATP-binding protein [Clostridium sp. DSM 8431]SFU85357.1 Histidine kinase-, DNA gyrase B-, and HSP90-like ATPase [Clostridium sp. DSM 8431]